MHTESMEFVRQAAERYLNGKRNVPLEILDVGAYDFNGSYREILDKDAWRYTGADIAVGPGVDVVVDEDSVWDELTSDTYDVVVCGQCFEHVKMFWVMAKSIFRVCKPGGYCFIVAPSMFRIHRRPIDCWRFWPDGLRFVMGEYAGFDTVEVGSLPRDTYYVGQKPEVYHDDE